MVKKFDNNSNSKPGTKQLREILEHLTPESFDEVGPEAKECQNALESYFAKPKVVYTKRKV